MRHLQGKKGLREVHLQFRKRIRESGGAKGQTKLQTVWSIVLQGMHSTEDNVVTDQGRLLVSLRMQRVHEQAR